MPRNRKSVEKLIDEASALSDEGKNDEALSLYRQALELDFNNGTVHYNVGLIHKYRNEWKESFRYNRRAVDLGGDEAAQWNLAIAATALRDWETAREMWKKCGMKIKGSGPIDDNFGTTPVRLQSEAKAEVVWARRICPVRARILSIPFPESETAFGDVVLHDGAPTGYRIDSEGREKEVFNVLEMFELGEFSTYVIEAEVDSPDEVQALEKLCDARDLQMEDWKQNTRILCRACSEGRPHEKHDHDAPKTEWNPERRIAIAAKNGSDIEAVLKEWQCRVIDWDVALER